MDHNFAVENHTAERYLIGELTETERDAYEEHFFCCTACAEEIKSASEFMESARRVIQDEVKSEVYGHAARHSLWGSWLNWRSMLQPFPAMACLLLIMVGGFAGYQNFVTIPGLAEGTPAFVIPPETAVLPLTQAHGEPAKAPAGKPLRLRFVIPKPDNPAATFGSYQADIVTGSNVKKCSFGISSPQAANPIDVALAAGPWAPGKYFVVIRGVSSGTEGNVEGELVRFPFELTSGD